MIPLKLLKYNNVIFTHMQYMVQTLLDILNKNINKILKPYLLVYR